MSALLYPIRVVLALLLSLALVVALAVETLIRLALVFLRRAVAAVQTRPGRCACR